MIHDALKDLEEALDRGDMVLARRYLSKLRERLVCRRCGGPIFSAPINAHEHYKALVHDECPR